MIVFDKRGTGLSSRDLGFGSLAERADDARAVMDAAGWKRAHLFGMSEGGPMAILLATTYPERVESLSLYGTYAVGGGAKPDDPAPPTIGPEREALLALLPQLWGTGVALRDSGLVAHADEAPEGLGAHFERNACTPHMIAEIMRRNYVIDVRPILSAVHVPTLVLHAAGDPVVNVAYGRHLAEHIDGARYVELPLVMHKLARRGLRDAARYGSRVCRRGPLALREWTRASDGHVHRYRRVNSSSRTDRRSPVECSARRA